MLSMLVVLVLWLVFQLFSLLLFVNKEGLSVLTLRGRRLLYWKDIKCYSVVPPLLILAVYNRRYFIDLTFFKNPERLGEYFERHDIGRR